MGTQRTILIVDDDVDWLAAAQAMLEAAGHRVLTAEDETSGMAAARAEHLDLIVLDLMMEETDSGVRLAHRLRASPETQHIPIIILTGVRAATGFEFCPETPADYAWIGADAWIEKPICAGELLALAAQFTEQRPVQGGEPQ
jgi:CheY-like chemotaxis protein